MYDRQDREITILLAIFCSIAMIVCCATLRSMPARSRVVFDVHPETSSAFLRSYLCSSKVAECFRLQFRQLLVIFCLEPADLKVHSLKSGLNLSTPYPPLAFVVSTG